MILKKLATTALIASVVGTASLSAAVPAQAGHHNGGAIAAGVVGGLALGAIAGSAVAGAPYGYGYPAYGPPPAPAYGGCYMSRQATYDPYGNFAGYRRVQVCE